METNTAAIEVRGLTKHYGAINALDQATLTVGQRTIFGLVGPNGSGKTTLIKALCGILRPDAGEVRALGIDALGDRFALRRRLGYMPQTAALYDDLSPLENLRFFGGAFPAHDLEKRMHQTLAFVKLWERKDDPVHTFSGGMRQRASLACALLHEPELLILDEPTAGVDPDLRQAFWEHFRDLCDQGRTIFMSTNQMDEALRCDRVAIIIKGSILIADTPRAIESRGQAQVTVSLASGERHTRNIDEYESELPLLLREFGLDGRVNRIEVRRPSFEEIILSLIKEAG
ncbi:MAG: ABC transporter ATP-binding protein [Thermoleophilia bacterium]